MHVDPTIGEPEEITIDQRRTGGNSTFVRDSRRPKLLLGPRERIMGCGPGKLAARPRLQRQRGRGFVDTARTGRLPARGHLLREAAGVQASLTLYRSSEPLRRVSYASASAFASEPSLRPIAEILIVRMIPVTVDGNSNPAPCQSAIR